METKILNPLDIEGKINYPCNAYFRHKTLGTRGVYASFSFKIGSWLYESEKSLKFYLYEDFNNRFSFNAYTIEDFDLVVIEYTKEEYIKHVLKEGGIMSKVDENGNELLGKGFVPADENYITKIFNNAKNSTK